MTFPLEIAPDVAPDVARAPRRPRLHHALARLLPLAVAAACASGASRASGPGGPGGAERSVRSDSVVLRVANRSAQALTISLARGTAGARLGEVAAGSDGRFALGAADVAKDRIVLVATANRSSMRTVPFRARGGQVVWFEIMPDLVGSQVRVRWPEEGPPKR